MPTFSFLCGSCGAEFDDVVSSALVETPCKCGDMAKRQFTPTANLKMTEWAKSIHDDHRSRQRQWIESAEVQEGLKSGKLAVDTSDPNCDNMTGVVPG